MMQAMNTPETFSYYEIPLHEMMLRVQSFVHSGNMPLEVFYGEGTVQRNLLDVTGL